MKVRVMTVSPLQVSKEKQDLGRTVRQPLAVSKDGLKDELLFSYTWNSVASITGQTILFSFFFFYVESSSASEAQCQLR